MGINWKALVGKDIEIRTPSGKKVFVKVIEYNKETGTVVLQGDTFSKGSSMGDLKILPIRIANTMLLAQEK